MIIDVVVLVAIHRHSLDKAIAQVHVFTQTRAALLAAHMCVTADKSPCLPTYPGNLPICTSPFLPPLCSGECATAICAADSSAAHSYPSAPPPLQLLIGYLWAKCLRCPSERYRMNLPSRPSAGVLRSIFCLRFFVPLLLKKIVVRIVLVVPSAVAVCVALLTVRVTLATKQH